MTVRDLLVFDLTGASALQARVESAGLDLTADHRALLDLLTEASTVTGTDQTAPLDQLGRVRATLHDLDADLTDRMERVAATLTDARVIDDLSARIRDPSGTDAAHLALLLREQQQLVAEMVRGHESAVDAVLDLARSGIPVLDAIDLVAARHREARVTALVEADGVSRAVAASRIDRLDAQLSALLESGLGWDEAAVTVSVADALDLDLEAARIRAASEGVGLMEVLGHMAVTESLGVSVDEAMSIDQLRAQFATFDNPAGGLPDGKVSVEDLQFVLANPARFAPSQVAAAEVVLASPDLLIRLDTAAANDDVLGPAGFGRTEPGDGLVSIDDIEAFVVKAQLNHALGPYADQIDVAADDGGVVDGYVSRADLERFVADTPDLPREVQVAAAAMIEAGFYDRTWLGAHRDELAMAAAVFGGAATVAAIVMTGGTATPVVVMGLGGVAGGAAGGGTTVALNAASDDHDAFDDVVSNTVKGSVLGSTTASLPIAFETAATATSLPVALAATADLTSDVATITTNGGFDILIPESIEDEVHDRAGYVSNLTGPSGALSR